MPEILQYAIDSKALDSMSPTTKAGAAPRDDEATFSSTRWDAEGVGRRELQLHQGPLRGLGSLPFVDFQDQLPLPSPTWFLEPIEVETRQCLCLHVAAAISGERSLTKVRSEALALRKEMLQKSVEAFAHLGDAPPHVSEAEAFVRHNAHDCFYPHHEKDYRSLALFASAFRHGTQWLVVRVSQSGRVEGDLVKGDGAPTSFGGVVIHRGHMRLLDLSTKAYHALFEHLEQSGRLVREVEAQGWAPFLDRTDLLGELLPSGPAPCARCHRPQTQCRVGLPLSEAPWDPALSPTLPAGVPLSERPAFQHGVYVQEVFAGWAGWTAGMVQQGFRSAPPIEYFEDPLSMTGPSLICGTPPSVLPFLSRPGLLQRLRCRTCGSSALRVPRFAIISVLMAVLAYRCGWKVMARGATKFRVMSSRRLLPMFASSCIRPGACLHSKAAPLLGAIPKYGTSRACSASGSRPERVSFPSICAPGTCNLGIALRASFIRKPLGGWFQPSCFPGFICFFPVTVLRSAPTISMRTGRS